MIQEWLEVTTKAFTKLSEDFELPECTHIESVGDIPRNQPGAYISLTNEEHAGLVGVLTTDQGQKALTANMLGMELEEVAELDEGEIADCMREVANILAGMVKSLLTGGEDLKLGLPVYSLSPLQYGSSVRSEVAKVRAGEHTFAIVIILGPTKSGVGAAGRKESAA
ncbi:MAG: chemotaxis protein CheX [Myxococcota bacterium]